MVGIMNIGEAGYRLIGDGIVFDQICPQCGNRDLRRLYVAIERTEDGANEVDKVSQ